MAGLLFRVPTRITSHGSDHRSIPEGIDAPAAGRPIVLGSVVARRGSPPSEARIDEIYRAESVELFRFLQAAVHDQDAAADILQETFLRLIDEWRSGRAPDNVHGWLYRVATNVMISGGRRTRTALRLLPRLASDRTTESAEARVLEAEQRAAVRAAMRTLPMDARAALLLSAQGFSAQEIGASLGRTDGAVRTLLSRARLRLRRELDASAANVAGKVG